MTTPLRTVVITGTSRGIGAALTREYLARGATVHGISRSTPAIDNPNYTHHSCDLGAFAEAAATLGSALPPCDLAILNAGVLGEFGDLGSADLGDLRTTMDINLWSNKVVIDALLQHDPKPQQIVGISSGAAVSGHRGWSGYALSKAALNMLLQLYAQEAPHTHFAALAPGTIDTAMQDVLCALPASDDFPSLGALQAKRHTDAMPSPQDAAPHIADFIATLPARCDSGDFVDIRSA